MNFYTENLADFGSRERAMAGELLSADLPRNFNGSGVRVAFNMNSGYVFLVNDDYQVAMMNGYHMAIFHTTPYHGHEGFLEDLLNELTPDELNQEDIDYILREVEIENIDLPEIWQKYQNGEENEE
jgi:hypothetical protein